MNPRRLYGVDWGEDGEPRPALEPGHLLAAGRHNWVILPSGSLVVGRTAHVILSGGGPVAGAGKLDVGTTAPAGRVPVSWVGLNFSGHYHPPLTAEYALFVARILRNHPALHLHIGTVFQGNLWDRGNRILLTLTWEEFAAPERELAATIRGDIS
jgi:hypothetical protein